MKNQTSLLVDSRDDDVDSERRHGLLIFHQSSEAISRNDIRFKTEDWIAHSRTPRVSTGSAVVDPAGYALPNYLDPITGMQQYAAFCPVRIPYRGDGHAGGYDWLETGWLVLVQEYHK
ncbi:MAG: hypothetical protein QM811_23740 [Pirellulales bacterium]